MVYFVGCNSVNEGIGIENGKIEDSCITSATCQKGFPPANGRLNSATCWSAGRNDKNQWLQVDVGQEKIITAISSQGRKDANQWVISYVVSYSSDGEKFENYQVNGADKVMKFNKTSKNIFK